MQISTNTEQTNKMQYCSSLLFQLKKHKVTLNRMMKPQCVAQG